MGAMTCYDVLCYGNVFVDRYAVVDSNFLKENNLEIGSTNITTDRKKIEITWNSANKSGKKGEETCGGSGANVAKTLKNLGVDKCALTGIRGNDEKGKNLEGDLKKRGIDTYLLEGKKENGIVNCFKTDNERTMQTYLGAVEDCSDNDIVQERFPNARITHLEGYVVCFGKTLKKCIDFASDRISLDLASRNIVQNFKKEFKENISRVHFLFGNQEEMRTLTDISDIKKAVESFPSHQTIVATLKEKGCCVRWQGQSDAQYFPTCKVDPIDPTGAGDFFTAGFIEGILKNKNAKECADKGNLAARFGIQNIGTDLPEDKWKELKELHTKI